MTSRAKKAAGAVFATASLQLRAPPRRSATPRAALRAYPRRVTAEPSAKNANRSRKLLAVTKVNSDPQHQPCGRAGPRHQTQPQGDRRKGQIDDGCEQKAQLEIRPITPE